MERLRRQRSQARFSSGSNVTTIIDRSSDDKLNSDDKSIRGNHHALKHQFQKPESDSNSRGKNRTTLKHQLAVESPTGNLMRSLLKDEMLKETESRRRAPNVIAKLMGLDRMPSQNGVSTQPRRSYDSRKSCRNRSCKKIAREHELFKDVYEVRESLKGQSEGYSSQMHLNRKRTDDEMAFVRQKFMDAKRLSTDERLQDSKEFHDAVDVLNSNNHLFLKLLQEPDSLYSKHLHASPQSYCGNVRNLKASKILDYNINAIGCQASREGSQKIDISFSRHCQEGVRSRRSYRHAPDPDRYECKEATNASPTKIVLLKPSLGMSLSSPCDEHWSDFEMHTTKQTHDRRGDTELWGKKRLPIDLNFSGHKSQESRELAKEITQQMKMRFGEGSFDVPLSGYKGYSADESSHDLSGNDSSNESDTTFVTSRTPYSTSFRGKSSASSRFAESSVNREGKKRLSDRWNMTHRSQEIKMEKGTTLGEMLSMPDWDIRSPKLDAEIAEDSSSSKYESKVKPLGISSKDGWKDGSIRNLSRSRSLPNAYGHVENPESHMKEGARHSRKKEGSSSESRRRSDKRPYSSRRMSKDMGNAEQEEQVNVNENKSVLKEKDSPENKSVTLEAPTCRLDTILKIDSTTKIEHENTHVSLNSGDNVLPEAELSTDLQIKDDSSSSSLHKSTPQIAQPESPTTSKEADQPSPVSVLEAPFAEDPSSGSECFERVSADLHGLRMQLQLLKLESNEYDEESLLISSDEDEESTECIEVAEGPTTLAETESWEASYITDVLAELEIEDNDPNTLMTTWNASECAVGPWVFEKLEKKYNDEEPSCSRIDRVLLFDRIKSGIMDIAQRSINPHPWVRTRGSYGTEFCWSKAWFEIELYKLLSDQETREVEVETETTCIAELALRDDVHWMDLGMYVDGVGREIGKIVLEELMAETFDDMN